ncbi:MAG: hypothetical protein QOH49_2362 [Acidobacteriota bacterium]|nr:hypothetical protein [Acidobacteriota bacterium]
MLGRVDGARYVRNPEAPEQSANRKQADRDASNPFAPFFVNASYEPGVSVAASSALRTQTSAAQGNGTEDFRPSFAKELTLAPKQTVEVEIPVPAGSDFGVTFMADASVSATLFDERSAVRGKSLAGSPESKGFFRTIFVEHIAGGVTLKLKLENTGAFSVNVVISAWNGAAAGRK